MFEYQLDDTIDIGTAEDIVAEVNKRLPEANAHLTVRCFIYSLQADVVWKVIEEFIPVDNHPHL